MTYACLVGEMQIYKPLWTFALGVRGLIAIPVNLANFLLGLGLFLFCLLVQCHHSAKYKLRLIAFYDSP